MIKILHTADIHLDSPLKSLAFRDETLRKTVQTATRTAFTRIIDTALAENVSALMIAGDLFDGAERSAKTAAFLISELDRLSAANIPVFYIKGNHDAENPITGELKLPENVHIFDGRGGKVQLGQHDIWIHGVSFSGRQASESLLPKFHAPVAGAVNIAMLHTSLSGDKAHDVYAPCTLAELKALGFDYWALGHIHKRQIYSQSPWIVMPGIPQGRDIGEAAAKSATLLHIDSSNIEIEEVFTSVAEFIDRQIDISDCETDDAIRVKLRKILSEMAHNIQSDAGIVRLTMSGTTARKWQIHRDQELWTETIAELARETGRLWLEKLQFSLKSSGELSGASSTAVDELAQIMADIQKEQGFQAELHAQIEAILTELPVHRRINLMPDEEAAHALGLKLAGEGANRVIAAMKGAVE